MKTLTETEARVLGCLVEKELTTPEYYPLSLNALVNACNQKSNRDPVMNLDESAVSDALRSLNKEGLAGPADAMTNRVTKYGHHLQEVFNFDRREIAVLCVLLLRGAQTPGELRARAERMYNFDDLVQVQSALQRLAQFDPAMARMLPRQPGTKEARFIHLLSGDVHPQESPSELASEPQSASTASSPDRLSRLETEIAFLQDEIAVLKEQFAAFRKQFE